MQRRHARGHLSYILPPWLEAGHTAQGLARVQKQKEAGLAAAEVSEHQVSRAMGAFHAHIPAASPASCQ